MREIANKERTLALIEHLGKQATGPGRVYLTGGSTAVLIGWRSETIDVDLKCDPEPHGIFEGIGRAKDHLRMNIEFASPDLFIPELPGWRNRSKYIATHGKVEFYHYDFYSQALATTRKNGAHSAYNALIRRLVSFSRAFAIHQRSVSPV